MDIQKTILNEAVKLYFEGKDWQGYIKKAIREQRRREQSEGILKQNGERKSNSNDRIRRMA